MCMTRYKEFSVFPARKFTNYDIMRFLIDIVNHSLICMRSVDFVHIPTVQRPNHTQETNSYTN